MAQIRISTIKLNYRLELNFRCHTRYPIQVDFFEKQLEGPRWPAAWKNWANFITLWIINCCACLQVWIVKSSSWNKWLKFRRYLTAFFPFSSRCLRNCCRCWTLQRLWKLQIREKCNRTRIKKTSDNLPPYWIILWSVLNNDKVTYPLFLSAKGQ